MDQLKQDLEALELGPMGDEDLDRMRRIGNHVYRNVNPVKAQLRGIMTIRPWS
jgi:hypothetical protein